MEIGKIIRLRAYDNQVINRRVIALRNKTVYVCEEKEYEKAHQEGREPVCVGFNVQYILNND